MNRHCLTTQFYAFLFLTLFISALLPGTLRAQSPLDVGVHFSPQLRYISSSTQGEEPTSGTFTRGLNGVSMGAGGGVYLEYEITPNWFIRGGVDLSYKRNHYGVEKVLLEFDSIATGSNQVVYTSIEVPVAVLYRFDYLSNGNSFLLGAATTLNRLTGAPRAWTTFASRSNLKDKITYPDHTFTVFGGYEHYLSSSLVLGFEPYLAYVPTRFNLETSTTAKVQIEAGLSVRLRLDN